MVKRFSLLLWLPVLLLGTGVALADTEVKTKVKAVSGTPADTVVAWSFDGEQVRVKSLDIDGNPFTKEYADVDRWIYSNIRPDIKISQLKFEDGRWIYTAEPELDVVVSRVTPEGYLLPQLSSKTVEVGPVMPSVVRNDDFYYVVAAGDMEPELSRVYVTERVKRLAPVAPRVPDWLVKQPADSVVFVPQEQYVVKRGKVWYRYDAAGNIVAETEPGQSWRVLYWPKVSDLIREASEKKWQVVDDSRYIVIRDADGKITTVYDYDGTPLKVDALPDIEPYYFTPMGWDVIEPLHDAQVNVVVDDDDPDADVSVEVDAD